MLDAGIQLEPDRARLVQALRQTAPEKWPPQDVQRFKEGMDPAISGTPQKGTFGSDHPHRDAVQNLGLATDGVGLEAVLALGEFSTVWGASKLPCLEGDVADWPVSTPQASNFGGRDRGRTCKDCSKGS
jgi:hypothetical protein